MVKGDNSGEAQVRPWKSIVDSWERTGGNQDVVVMGDMNLDFKQWNTLDGYEGEIIEQQSSNTGFYTRNKKDHAHNRG